MADKAKKKEKRIKKKNGWHGPNLNRKWLNGKYETADKAKKKI